MITRLQLGTSRLENLDPEILPKFLDKTWIHFGDTEPSKTTKESLFLKLFSSSHSISFKFRAIYDRFWLYIRKPRKSAIDVDELYRRTNFCDFFYQKGDQLPFDDNSINFIFSEHFFEHLFLDEALSLFKECNRILKPAGVIRTCVPDADLRTYAPPEPLGFPDIKLPFTDPTKHKTRWSVYSLTEALTTTGFSALPLRYCNKQGEYIKVNPLNVVDEYRDCPEKDLVNDLTYIFRVDSSLIVDGIKKVS